MNNESTFCPDFAEHYIKSMPIFFANVNPSSYDTVLLKIMALISTYNLNRSCFLSVSSLFCHWNSFSSSPTISICYWKTIDLLYRRLGLHRLIRGSTIELWTWMSIALPIFCHYKKYCVPDLQLYRSLGRNDFRSKLYPDSAIMIELKLFLQKLKKYARFSYAWFSIFNIITCITNDYVLEQVTVWTHLFSC